MNFISVGVCVGGSMLFSTGPTESLGPNSPRSMAQVPADLFAPCFDGADKATQYGGL